MLLIKASLSTYLPNRDLNLFTTKVNFINTNTNRVYIYINKVDLGNLNKRGNL